MKKVLFAFLLIINGTACAAQSLLGEYLKEVGYEGQPGSLVIKGISSSLSIVRQQFRLERNGKYYGKNNMPFYGETYSLGVKISGGEIFQNQVFRPWVFDTDYMRVNQAGKYKPVYFWSFQRAINDSVFKPVEMELETEYVRPVNSDSLIFMHTDAQSDFGLNVDETAGKKTGFLIWAYASSMNDSAMQVSLRQLPLQIVTYKDSLIEVNPEDSDKILGGIYVVPVIEKAGVIRLRLVGVCAKVNANDWALCLLTKDERQKVIKTKKSSKKSKETSKEESEPTPIK